MIIRFIWRLLCFIAPWLVLIIFDNPGGAVVALIMQGTIIGWIPAYLWAWRTYKEAQPILPKVKKQKASK